MRIFCSICKDIYIPCSEVHVTNCGHLYHASCISTWFKQHRTCPQCRASLSQPFRVYFDVEKGEETDKATLERQIELLTDRLRESEKCKRKLLEENKNLEKIAQDMKECTLSLTRKNGLMRTSVDTLKEEVKRLTRQNEIVNRLQGEVDSLKAKLSILERVETVINGSTETVTKMIESTPVTGLAVKQLCTYVGVLKDQLKKIETKNSRLAKENRDISKALSEEKQKNFSGSEELIKTLTDKNTKLENDLASLNVLFKDYKRKYSNRFKPLPLPQNCGKQESSKRGMLDLETFLEEEENISNVILKDKDCAKDTDRRIKKWEELVCAGPIQNLAYSRARSFGRGLYEKGENSASGLPENYGYDGYGGSKKIKLGVPTPREEFEKLKQKKDKKGAQMVHHKKIVDYFQTHYEN